MGVASGGGGLGLGGGGKAAVSAVALSFCSAKQEVELGLAQRFDLGYFARAIGPSLVEVAH